MGSRFGLFCLSIQLGRLLRKPILSKHHCLGNLLDLIEEQPLIAELDARQDEVLRELDELNLRVEAALAQWSRPAQEDLESGPPPIIDAVGVESAPVLQP